MRSLSCRQATPPCLTGLIKNCISAAKLRPTNPGLPHLPGRRGGWRLWLNRGIKMAEGTAKAKYYYYDCLPLSRCHPAGMITWPFNATFSVLLQDTVVPLATIRKSVLLGISARRGRMTPDRFPVLREHTIPAKRVPRGMLVSCAP